MQERVRFLLNGAAFWVLGAGCVWILGASAHGLGALFASLLAGLAHLNVQLWARCQHWPVVVGTFVQAPASSRSLLIEYTYDASTFSRPAQRKGEPGGPVSLRIDPTHPSISALDLPRPSNWFALRAVGVAALVAILAHAGWLAAQRAA